MNFKRGKPKNSRAGAHRLGKPFKWNGGKTVHHADLKRMGEPKHRGFGKFS